MATLTGTGSTVPSQTPRSTGFVERLLGLGQGVCCCASDSQPMPALDMIGPQIGRDFFLKEFAINDSQPDQILEAEKVDRSLTMGLAGGQGGTNPLRLQLLAAVRNDDASGVLQHVADGADIALMGEALRLAAHRGSASVVRELVAVGLSVNDSCPQTHFTPIHLASAGGHHVVCEVLLDALADVHKPIGGTSALSMARKSGHAEVEEVITRHITSLVMNDQGENNDNSQANRRAHVLPRVSPFLSEAVLQALPSPPCNEKDDAGASREDGHATTATVSSNGDAANNGRPAPETAAVSNAFASEL
eukprot:TRINITY_DN74515_c0_g1_i1.p1 TRINITY_DN74515_c0_g1~~TRINITY_DN74515_c0_g1_i1.p1  ORF type:complete len:325 (-),score=50.12 TRINITY_DN74515_c0_g1_i1:327-1241(-)